MSRKEHILLKKLAKGNTKWGKQNTVLYWATDTVDQFLALQHALRENISSAMASPNPPPPPETL